MKEEQQKSGCVTPLVILVAGSILGFCVTMLVTTLADDGRQAPTSVIVAFEVLMAVGFVAFNKPYPGARVMQFATSFAMGGLLQAFVTH